MCLLYYMVMSFGCLNLERSESVTLTVSTSISERSNDATQNINLPNKALSSSSKSACLKTDVRIKL